MLDDVREQLAKEVEDKINLRVDYENRINEYKVIHERDIQIMRDQIAMYEKHYENQTSKASMTHIEHNTKFQNSNQTQKSLMLEKRNLQKQIENKNKEIETLNLRIQKLEGYQRREVEKLEAEVNQLKEQHQKWLNNQQKQNEEWARERSELKDRAHENDLKYKRQVDATNELENKLNKEIEKRNI